MIFESLAASIGSPKSVSDDSIFARVWGGGHKTNAGVFVNHDNAINIPAVYAAVGIIADGISMLPADVRQKRSGEGSDPVSDHPVSHILNVEANPFMSAITARNTMAYHQVLWGNGYQEIEKNNRGEARALFPLLPDRTAPEKTEDKSDVRYKTTIDGQGAAIQKEGVVHVPAMSFDGFIGASPVSVARQAMGLAIAAEEFGAKFFGNDAKSGGFVTHPGKLSETGQANLSNFVNKQGGLDNAHRIKVLEEGVKFVQTTIPPEDAQFLGTREFQIAEIARIFRVPLVLLQAMEKSTSWGSGIEQMMLGFLIWTLNPWIIRTEQEYNRKLFTEAEREKGLFVKLNVNALMRGDMTGRAAFYNSGITAGWMTRNEAREKEDMNPLPGLDEPLAPLNMGTGNERNDQ